jgi:hypothetical protein
VIVLGDNVPCTLSVINREKYKIEKIQNEVKT